jgi:hypothetical protein
VFWADADGVTFVDTADDREIQFRPWYPSDRPRTR